MAGEIPDLHATVRTGTGKGAARQARREGHVPGIVYGGGVDPLPINIPFNVLFKRLKQGRFLATLFNMKVDGHDDVRVICRNVQRDVVKDLPTHVDFMRLKRTSKIALFIPVEIEGEDDCPGIRRGGVLTMVRPEVELVVTAGDIPEKVTLSIAGLEIGDSASISAVDLPAGAKPTIDRDFVIATIQPPSGLAASDEEEEGAEPAADEVPVAGEEAEEGEAEASEE
ncbi:MAG: 50S ribosomal protein L25/general stress protein Ctc [Paracoccaceae bacterium]|nr:50S ribosomal protein L25/general stress protein Ctc [Paracoccaceae bacterium]